MTGKGSARRPSTVSRDEYDRRYDLALGGDNNEAHEQLHEEEDAETPHGNEEKTDEDS